MAVVIRDFHPEEQADYLALSQEFYSTDAVSHPVPPEFFKRTFHQAMVGNPALRLLAILQDDQLAGFALLALTWSNEAGGLCIWLEEAYLRPEHRSHGLGQAFFAFVEREYAGVACRLRLEVTASNQDAVRLYRKMGFTDLPYLQMVKEL